MEGIQRIQLRESDIITFHNYSWPEDFQERRSRGCDDSIGP